MIAIGSIFTGLGMFDLGFVVAGCDILLQCEIDPYCQEVLRARREQYWPNATLVFDAADPGYDWEQWRGRLDILIGGFPCQPFSVAGARGGEADERNMWPAFARIIGAVRPRAVVLENVDAICAPYTDAAGVRRPAYALTVVGDLSTLGYDAQWGIISAADAGAPHLRDRWWCVAYADGVGSLSPDAGHGCTNSQRVSSPQRERQSVESGTDARGGDVADADGQRRPQRAGLRARVREQRAAIARGGGKIVAVSGVAAEPGLVRVADGIAHRLVEHRWPAPPGPAQYAHEPPRTQARGSRADERVRKARVGALGNGLIPQIAYALAVEVAANIKDKEKI